VRTLPVSVIIPTYNSARTLDACLESCLRQHVDAQEVVVVDDVRTSDATREITHSHGARLVVSEAGIAESRNLGAAATTQPYLFHIDSDMKLDSGLVAAALQHKDATNADALIVAERSTGHGPWLPARALDKIAIEFSAISRAARFLTRESFDLIGGYDPNLTAGEDIDLHRRLVEAGLEIVALSSPGIEHDEGVVTLTGAWKKKYRYGRTMPAFLDKYPQFMSRHEGLARIRAGLRDVPNVAATVRLRYLVLKAADLGGFTAGRLMARASFRPIQRPRSANGRP
jgi:arabinofuranan 3-O-arabinosyltransferase